MFCCCAEEHLDVIMDGCDWFSQPIGNIWVVLTVSFWQCYKLLFSPEVSHPLKHLKKSFTEPAAAFCTKGCLPNECWVKWDNWEVAVLLINVDIEMFLVLTVVYVPRSEGYLWSAQNEWGIDLSSKHHIVHCCSSWPFATDVVACSLSRQGFNQHALTLNKALVVCSHCGITLEACRVCVAAQLSAQTRMSARLCTARRLCAVAACFEHATWQLWCGSKWNPAGIYLVCFHVR